MLNLGASLLEHYSYRQSNMELMINEVNINTVNAILVIIG
jgi:hypothetical protein